MRFFFGTTLDRPEMIKDLTYVFMSQVHIVLSEKATKALRKHVIAWLPERRHLVANAVSCVCNPRNSASELDRPHPSPEPTAAMIDPQISRS